MPSRALLSTKSNSVSLKFVLVIVKIKFSKYYENNFRNLSQISRRIGALSTFNKKPNTVCEETLPFSMSLCLFVSVATCLSLSVLLSLISALLYIFITLSSLQMRDRRYRERDRETERQRDRETERQRDRETERQRDRDGVCKAVSWSVSKTDRENEEIEMWRTEREIKIEGSR